MRKQSIYRPGIDTDCDMTRFSMNNESILCATAKGKTRIFGLENNRFNCYLNSVLQCLFALRPFRKFY